MGNLRLAVFPLAMVAMNLCYLVCGILGESRIKPNTVRFAMLYLSTVPAALEGDLSPFINVLALPG